MGRKESWQEIRKGQVVWEDVEEERSEMQKAWGEGRRSSGGEADGGEQNRFVSILFALS